VEYSQQGTTKWSCCDQSPSGRLLVVEPDYLPDSKVCFSHAWTPFPNGGCGGDFPPTTIARGIQGGAETIFVAPPGGGLGDSTPEAKYWEKIPCKIL
jgi:hypothetical protein